MNMTDLRTKLPVFDLEGKKVETVQLPPGVFDGDVNETLLYETVKMYEARKRQGNASTKTRSGVRGGGAKPWRQKGTGRARFGSSRNPLWRHGGVAFGPRPRDFSYSMPKKALRKALVSSMNARLNEEAVKFVVPIDFQEPRTRIFRQMLEGLGVSGKVLVVVSEIRRNVRLSARNLKRVSLMDASSVNALDVLVNESLLIEKDALDKITERVS